MIIEEMHSEFWCIARTYEHFIELRNAYLKANGYRAEWKNDGAGGYRIEEYGILDAGDNFPCLVKGEISDGGDYYDRIEYTHVDFEDAKDLVNAAVEMLAERALLEKNDGA